MHWIKTAVVCCCRICWSLRVELELVEIPRACHMHWIYLFVILLYALIKYVCVCMCVYVYAITSYMEVQH